MKIYKITEASEYLGVSINTLKTLANNGKINSFKTAGGHRRFRQDDFMEGVAVERRKIRLRMSLSNLMEFKKEDFVNERILFGCTRRLGR